MTITPKKRPRDPLQLGKRRIVNTIQEALG
jgi:hypothetical protein